MLGIHFHDIKLKRGKSYLESPKRSADKKVAIRPKNTKDNKCFESAITVALNHREIGKNPQRISKIRPHINKYNWKDIDFPAGTDEYKKFEKDNNHIALNIFVPYNKKEINIIYTSKYNRKCKNQVVLLMITDNEQEDTKGKWQYIALKSEITDNRYKKPIQALSGLFRRVTSNHNGDFHCLGSLHSFRTHVLKRHERLCNNDKYCEIVMPA